MNKDTTVKIPSKKAQNSPTSNKFIGEKSTATSFHSRIPFLKPFINLLNLIISQQDLFIVTLTLSNIFENVKDHPL